MYLCHTVMAFFNRYKKTTGPIILLPLQEIRTDTLSQMASPHLKYGYGFKTYYVQS